VSISYHNYRSHNPCVTDLITCQAWGSLDGPCSSQDLNCGVKNACALSEASRDASHRGSGTPVGVKFYSLHFDLVLHRSAVSSPGLLSITGVGKKKCPKTAPSPTSSSPCPSSRSHQRPLNNYQNHPLFLGIPRPPSHYPRCLPVYFLRPHPHPRNLLKTWTQ